MRKVIKRKNQRKSAARRVKAGHWHIVLMVVVILLNLVVWFGFPLKTQATTQGYQWPYEEERFMPLINSMRTSIGVPTLSRSDCLTRAARAWSANMASNNTLVHSDVSSFVTSYCGTEGAGSWTSAGENIVYSTGVMFGSDAYNIWHASPGHLSNMQNGYYTYTGLGFFYDTAHNKTWGTEEFVGCDSGCSSLVTSPPTDDFSNYASQCFNTNAPDSVKAGQTFSTEIDITNIGSAVWFGDTYTMVSNNPGGSNVWGKSSLQLGVGTHDYAADPGLIPWADATFTAPSQPGTYPFYWQIRSSGGVNFGAVCGKNITVTGTGTGTTSSQSAAAGSTTGKPGTSASSSGTTPGSASQQSESKAVAATKPNNNHAQPSTSKQHLAGQSYKTPKPSIEVSLVGKIYSVPVAAKLSVLCLSLLTGLAILAHHLHWRLFGRTIHLHHLG